MIYKLPKVALLNSGLVSIAEALVVSLSCACTPVEIHSVHFHCPYCYNHPKPEWGKIDVSDSESESSDGNDEMQLKRNSSTRGRGKYASRSGNRRDHEKHKEQKVSAAKPKQSTSRRRNLVLSCPMPDGHPSIQALAVQR